MRWYSAGIFPMGQVDLKNHVRYERMERRQRTTQQTDPPGEESLLLSHNKTTKNIMGFIWGKTRFAKKVRGLGTGENGDVGAGSEIQNTSACERKRDPEKDRLQATLSCTWAPVAPDHVSMLVLATVARPVPELH